MIINILAISTTVSAIVALLVMIAVVISLAAVIVVERKKYKVDKIVDIGDEPELKQLHNFLHHRITNPKKKVYFTLLLAGFDGYDQVTEFLTPQAEQEYMFKVRRTLRMTLPKGGKIALLPERDNFLIYLPELQVDEDALFAECKRFKDAFEKRIKVTGGIFVQKNATIAAAQFSKDASNLDELLFTLTTHFYSVKKSGGNSIIICGEKQEVDKSYIKFYQDLKLFIDRHELTFSFYPIYTSTLKRPAAFYANLILPPEINQTYRQLLPKLRKSQDSFWLFIWMLEHAALYNLNTFNNAEISDFFVILPMDAQLAMLSDAAHDMQQSLARYSLSPRAIVLEILASDLIGEQAVHLVKALTELKGVGFRFAIECQSISQAEQAVQTFNAEYIKLPRQEYQEAANQQYDFTKLNAKLVISGVESIDGYDRQINTGEHIMLLAAYDKKQIQKIMQ